MTDRYKIQVSDEEGLENITIFQGGKKEAENFLMELKNKTRLDILGFEESVKILKNNKQVWMDFVPVLH